MMVELAAVDVPIRPMKNEQFELSDESTGRLLQLAFGFATRSPDPSTQNGALIVNHRMHVLGHGWNEFPNGVKYSTARWECPIKYSFIEHAERNSIFDAARDGAGTFNATMFAVWAACAECARAIVQSGMARLVRCAISNDQDESAKRWRESVELGDVILREGGVEIVEFAGALGDVPAIRRDGKLWTP